jgi:sec-independent protein translocase protein TatA
MTTAFGMPSGWEFWIILVVALLLFGHRIPGMARSLGSGIVEFKKGLRSGDKDSLPNPQDPPDQASTPTESREKQEANT